MNTKHIVLTAGALIAMTASGCAQSTAQETLSPQMPPVATVSSKSVQMASADGGADKKICRRTAVTGSLVKTTRVCFTQREWLAMAEETKTTWEEVQGSKGSTNGQ